MKKHLSVTEFIARERKKGSSDAQIQRKMLEAGWQMDIIRQALQPKPAPKTRRPSQLKPARQEKLRKIIKTPVFLGGSLVFLLLLALFI